MKKRILKGIGIVAFLVGIFANTSLSLDNQSTQSNINLADLFKIEQASAECDSGGDFIYMTMTYCSGLWELNLACVMYMTSSQCSPAAYCCKW